MVIREEEHLQQRMLAGVVWYYDFLVLVSDEDEYDFISIDKIIVMKYDSLPKTTGYLV